MSALPAAPAVRPTAACWFEIPAADFRRAVAFYEALLDVTLKQEDMDGLSMGVFPYAEPGVGGAVASGHGLAPAADGPVVYLNADGRLDAALARVSSLGGAVVMPRTELPGDMGSIALIRDSEGNRVGLHAVS